MRTPRPLVAVALVVSLTACGREKSWHHPLGAQMVHPIYQPGSALALRTGLVAHLGILDHGEVVYLDRVTTTRVSLPTRVGCRQPAYCTALGKVMLAFADPASQAAALADMRPRTEFTVTDPRAMNANLEGWLIRACERGLIPDALVRAGMRRLMRERLRDALGVLAKAA